MKFLYLAEMGKDLGKYMKSHEDRIIEVANKLGINTERIIIDYTKNSEYFRQRGLENIFGTADVNGDNIAILVNLSIMTYYADTLTKVAKQENVSEYTAKLYALTASRLLVRQILTMNEDFIKMTEFMNNDIMGLLLEMYATSRIIGDMPECNELIILVNDPYSYMDADMTTEISWSSLFDSVTYHTNKCSGDNKNFYNAMIKNHPGKILEQPNQVDRLIGNLENCYNTLLENRTREGKKTWI